MLQKELQNAHRHIFGDHTFCNIGKHSFCIEETEQKKMEGGEQNLVSLLTCHFSNKQCRGSYWLYNFC